MNTVVIMDITGLRLAFTKKLHPGNTLLLSLFYEKIGSARFVHVIVN